MKGLYQRSAFGCSLVFTFPLAQLETYAHQVAALEKNPNPFALAVAVQLKALETRGDNQRRSEWKKQFIGGLYRRKYPRQRIVALLRFMDEAMRLPAVMEEEIQETIRQIEEGKKMPVLMYAERKAKAEGKREGLQEGLQEGEQKAAVSLVVMLLTRQLGELSDTLQTKLRKLSVEQLQLLFTAAFQFETKSDLTVWLKQHAASAPRRRNGSHNHVAA